MEGIRSVYLFWKRVRVHLLGLRAKQEDAPRRAWPALRFPAAWRSFALSVTVGVACGAVLYFASVRFMEQKIPPAPSDSTLIDNQPDPSPTNRTLVLYWYDEVDAIAMSNLHVFMAKGVENVADTVHYILIAQGAGEPYPNPPASVSYVERSASCIFGAVGQMLADGLIDTDSFTHYVFLSSTARGPYLPLYGKGVFSWVEFLQGRLSSSVRMVGSTIACDPGEAAGQAWDNPYVEFSGAVLLDADAMALLRKDDSVFKCHESPTEQHYLSEVGASRVLLENGYNLASLHLRQDGVDWQQGERRKCRESYNVYHTAMFDFIGLHPHILMFVPVSTRSLHVKEWQTRHTSNLDKWKSQEAQQQNVCGWTEEDVTEGRLSKVLWSAVHLPIQCFNVTQYWTWYPSLTFLTPQDSWLHFINHGQFEERKIPFRCQAPPSYAYPYIQSLKFQAAMTPATPSEFIPYSLVDAGI